MKLKSLTQLLANVTDEEMDIDEILKGNEDISKMFEKPITLDAVKDFVTNNEEGKQYLQSYGDKRVTDGIKTWKDKNLQILINDEVLKATGKKKTPEQLKMEELEKKFNESEAKRIEAENTGKLKDMLSGAGLDPIKTLEFFNINNMDNIDKSIGNFKAIIDERVKADVKEQLSAGNYPPPGENGSGELTANDIAKMMM
ncbi:DUF4355 domain-containing protein [Clostridium neonatale]|uniref:DUF4355 domain-containing protein n=1 Tax=Clostridium neonatale TaxID=137838 RepID=A0AAD2DFJ4_9CLOT|nr:DUF4355 domain-containing protein [Clostridium neonatale]CAI3211796.1 conserved hypothetical protein [Clostridium neonatale]CAI3214607.1 conserved hypothetical protein [Clostridium neonatale]CAI3215845.1 conserved hypothetical protein [Clostridium neonatale]CAI3246802.1 conserved hypothetical protein [Clostridium neonatale]CAI3247753.1 conserved hypothetical protein [Clostridium neonatale]